MQFGGGLVCFALTFLLVLLFFPSIIGPLNPLFLLSLLSLLPLIPLLFKCSQPGSMLVVRSHTNFSMNIVRMSLGAGLQGGEKRRRKLATCLLMT